LKIYAEWIAVKMEPKEMLIVSDEARIRSEIARYRAEIDTGKVALVPTMGALHAGHLSLIQLAQERADIVVVSIFVNPSQFNEQNDFENYPITLERDFAQLEELGVDLVYTPNADDLYTQNFQSWVAVEGLGDTLEGAQRPGHFRGVTTVVSMLFNIIRPDCAVFGEKDFQQLAIIERMVRELKFDIEIIRAGLVRESTGLALSSRNARLSAQEREQALGLSAALQAMHAAHTSGERSVAALRATGQEVLQHYPGVAVVYLEVVDEATLATLEQVTANARVLIAAQVGALRLIDNQALGE